MSDTFIAPFIVLIVVSIPFIIRGDSRTPNASQRKSLRIGGILFGLGFTYFTLFGFILEQRSPRPQIIGKIDDLNRHAGGRYPSTYFRLDVDDGETAALETSYTGPELENGTMAEVRYLEFDHSILHLKLLDGSHSGWVLDEPETNWLWLIGVAMALLGFYIAFVCGRRSDSVA